MFRRRNDNDLPTTTSATKRASFTFRPPKGSDGSARSINLRQKRSLYQVWKEASGPVRVSYSCLFGFLLCLYLGIRSIRYYNSHVHLDCQSDDCRLSILPIGWKRKLVVTFPRRQLLQTFSVKTDENGKYVSSNPTLDDDVVKNHHSKYAGKNKHSKPSKNAHYKGPDKQGEYYSYAVTLRDKVEQEQQQKPENTEEDASGDSDNLLVDLSALDPYTTSLESGTRTLVMRQFRIGQSKRRVRTMLTRVESYIKQRRQRLVVKENGVPSWQGILLIVLGLVGFLLTVLIGQFWDEPPKSSSGPGVRRQQQQQQQQQRQQQQQQLKRRSVEETREAAYLRTTPARYEVRTKPAATNRFK